MNLLNLLPTATVTGMLTNTANAVDSWSTQGTRIFGYAMLLIGILAVLGGMYMIKKHQPSTVYWIVAVLALIFGGYFSQSGGFNTFKSDAGKQGKDALTGVLENGK